MGLELNLRDREVYSARIRLAPFQNTMDLVSSVVRTSKSKIRIRRQIEGKNMPTLHVTLTTLCSILFVMANVEYTSVAASPPPAPLLMTWSAYLSGTWNCRSGSTPYTVTYKIALGGRWI